MYVQRILPKLFLAGLLLWGIPTILLYTGESHHLGSFLPEHLWIAIMEEAPSTILRGLYGLIPTLKHVLVRSKPFIGYTLISILCYGGYIFYTALKQGRWHVTARLSVLHLLFLFLGSIWLLQIGRAHV